MFQPNQTDWQIIALLNQDGRLSSAEISRQLGDVSARTVTNRIDLLIENGIINIRAILNPDSLGYDVLADVFIQTEPGLLRQVAHQVATYPQISYVACATGDTDIIISVRTQDLQELYYFVSETVGKIPGVRHTKTYLLPLNIKDTQTWLPPDIFEISGDD
jgi:Lrp/AsnC family transcriptional regulator for asnA, asnC and gidA